MECEEVEMEFRKELFVLETFGWGGYWRKNWEIKFSSHLSEEEKRDISLESFLWHLCSFEAVSCLSKEEAVRSFHQQNKRKCIVFYQYIDKAYIVENAESLLVQDLPYDRLHMYSGDVYVMDWEGKWTFIMTHERECGPYFIEGHYRLS